MSGERTKKAAVTKSVFVDTSVWSLAFRRDSPSSAIEVRALTRMIEAGEAILTTGLVLQELLQGFSGPKAHAQGRPGNRLNGNQWVRRQAGARLAPTLATACARGLPAEQSR